MAIYYKIYKIYKITNLINDKSYIGVTSGKLSIRFKAHKKSYDRGSRLLLHCDMNYFGVDCFSIETLNYIISNQLPTNIESMYMHKHNTLHPFGYNIKSDVFYTNNIKKYQTIPVHESILSDINNTDFTGKR